MRRLRSCSRSGRPWLNITASPQSGVRHTPNCSAGHAQTLTQGGLLRITCTRAGLRALKASDKADPPRGEGTASVAELSLWHTLRRTRGPCHAYCCRGRKPKGRPVGHRTPPRPWLLATLRAMEANYATLRAVEAAYGILLSVPSAAMQPLCSPAASRLRSDAATSAAHAAAAAAASGLARSA